MRTKQITVTPNKNAPIYTAQFHAWLYNELKEYIDKKIISIFYSSAYGCVVTLRDTPSEELRLLEMSPLMSRDDLLSNIKLWIRLKTSDAEHHDRQ